MNWPGRRFYSDATRASGGDTQLPPPEGLRLIRGPKAFYHLRLRRWLWLAGRFPPLAFLILRLFLAMGRCSFTFPLLRAGSIAREVKLTRVSPLLITSVYFAANAALNAFVAAFCVCAIASSS